MAQAVEERYKQMPIITRSYLTAAIAATIGCSLELLEENSFRGRTADFFYKLLFGASVLTGMVLIGGSSGILSPCRCKCLGGFIDLVMLCVVVAVAVAGHPPS